MKKIIAFLVLLVLVAGCSLFFSKGRGQEQKKSSSPSPSPAQKEILLSGQVIADRAVEQTTEFQFPMLSFGPEDLASLARMKRGKVLLLDIGTGTLRVETKDVQIQGEKLTYVGVVKGDPYSTVVLTFLNGIPAGTIITKDKRYKIKPVGQGQGELVDLSDLSPVPPRKDDAIVPEVARKKISPDIVYITPTSTNSADTNDVVSIYDYQGLIWAIQNFEYGDVSYSPQKTAVIDVLVVYSPSVFEFFDRSPEKVKAAIQNIFDTANVVFQNSRTYVRLRPVGFIYVNNDVIDTWDTETALYEFSPPVDDPDDTTAVFYGMDQWLDTYGADMAVLFRIYRSEYSYYGMAFIEGESSYLDPDYYNPYKLFSAVVNIYSGDSITLAHEIGHLLGCCHDLDHTSLNGAYSFGNGYCFDGGGTVMSYCSPRIPVFSDDKVYENLDSYWQGLFVVGNATTSCAMAIRRVAPLAAEVRPSVQPFTPVKHNGDVNGDGKIDLEDVKEALQLAATDDGRLYSDKVVRADVSPVIPTDNGTVFWPDGKITAGDVIRILNLAQQQ